MSMLGHWAAGLAGAVLVTMMLSEFFVTFLLPHRVRHDPRVARKLFRMGWVPWRGTATRVPPRVGDTMLGLYGPMILVGLLVLWTLGLVVGFGTIAWATRANLGNAHTYGAYLYDSAATFLSVSGNGVPHGIVAHALQLGEAASALVVLFISIGYLPQLYQAFSRRETTVSQLDARAGSPPTAGALVLRSTARNGWSSLDDYLGEWEAWAAELMETHLSYPALAYFRSQHVNQNWLAALVTVMDASAFVIACADTDDVDGARFTFALGRHALADLAFTFRATPAELPVDRLPREQLDELVRQLGNSGLGFREIERLPERLARIRASYEPYAAALAASLELTLPAWVSSAEVARSNWRSSTWHGSGDNELH